MGLIIQLLKVGACMPATFLYYLLPPPFGVHPQCVHGLLAFVSWGLIVFLSPPPSLCCFVGVATVAPCWLEVLGHVMAQPAMCFTPNVLLYQQRREIVLVSLWGVQVSFRVSLQVSLQVCPAATSRSPIALQTCGRIALSSPNQISEGLGSR